MASATGVHPPHKFSRLYDSRVSHVTRVKMLTTHLFFAQLLNLYTIWSRASSKTPWTQIYEAHKQEDTDLQVVLLGRLLFILDDKNQSLDIVLLHALEGCKITQPSSIRLMHIDIHQSESATHSNPQDSDLNSDCTKEEKSLLNDLCGTIETGFSPVMSGERLLFVNQNQVYDIESNAISNAPCNPLPKNCFFLDHEDFYYTNNQSILVCRNCQNADNTGKTENQITEWASCPQEIHKLMPVYQTEEATLKKLLMGIWASNSQHITYFYPIDDPSNPIQLEEEARFLGVTSKYLFYQSCKDRLYQLSILDRESYMLAKEPVLFMYVPGTSLPYEFLMFIAADRSPDRKEHTELESSCNIS